MTEANESRTDYERRLAEASARAEARIAEFKARAETRAAVRQFVDDLASIAAEVWGEVGKEALKALALSLVAEQIEKLKR